MSKCCAWLNILFNILVGSVTALGGLNLAVLAIGFGGSPAEILAVVGPLIVGGLLYAFSGAILWWSRPSVSGKALIVQGLAVLFGIAYCLIMFGNTEYDSYDEEHRLFMAVPAIGVLLVSIQLVYLFSKWLRKGECRPAEGATMDRSDASKVKRRWYQFSTRTLIKVAVILFVLIAWIGSMANDRRIVAELRELGPASVFYAWGYVETVHLDGRNEDTDAALECLNGLAMLRRLSLSGGKFSDSSLDRLKGLTSLRSLELNNTDFNNTQITDIGMEHLRGLTKLKCLALHNTQITDAGLDHLKGMTDLRELDLDNTQITDAGLEHLKGLTDLRKLALSGTQITDAGLEHLIGLADLRELTLNNTQVTDAGLVHLKGLVNLASVQLRSTQVTEEGATTLRQALPECHNLTHDCRH